MTQDPLPAVKSLEGFFETKSVAVIGASSNPAKIGFQILNNVVSGGFSGDIYPINPKDEEILGHRAYKSVLDVPGAVDLAVITIPAPHVEAAMAQCAEKGVKNVAIITSGFGEVGNTEEELRLKKIADENNMPFIGPNILGFLYTPLKLNASFGPQEILPGKIAFVSQSGALAIALMGWTLMEKIGLGCLVSLGNKADVDEKDLIEYFNKDDNMDVVLIYMEGLKDGRRFLQTKIKKPVIVLKVGRSQRGAKAAASHTGSLAGADKVFDAAFKQMGILRAKSFSEAFGWARAFSLPLPKGKDTLIITNGGGIGVSTTDECENAGINLLEDPDWLEQKFRKMMPDFGSTKNPVDITGGAGLEGYKQALEVAFEEDKINAVIVLYCETAVTDPMDIARAIEDAYGAAQNKKPVVAAMVGGERSRAALQHLNEKNIPGFDSVEGAVSALKVLFSWNNFLEMPREKTEEPVPPQAVIDKINKIKAEGRTVLLEHEARELLESCGVPTPGGCFVSNADEAVEKAKGLYPLAMKIASEDIVHKTDVGGVTLNIQNAEELREKFDEMMTRVKERMPQARVLGVNLVKMMTGIECIVGLSQDPQFGPVVMFGLGGVFVEALKDVSFRVVPFGQAEAQRMIYDIKSKKVLDGFRGMKAHIPSLLQTLCAIQKLAPYVKEVDINPLLTNDEGSFAVDARIIL